MTNNAVEMNFFSDFTDLCRRELAAAGYAVNVTESAEGIVTKYFNIRHRRVDRRSRAIHRAKDFTCPPEHTVGLKALFDKVAKGDDLRPHHSTKLRNADYNDAMLNDFGIHHFHLGTGPHPKFPGFISRTGPVLYAMVTKDDFYCINVMSHRNWSTQELLEAVYVNWPQVLAPYKAKSSTLPVQGLAVHYSDDEVAQLRKSGVQPITQRKDGAIHIPPGGGLTLTGTSARVSTTRAKLVSHCRELQKAVAGRVDELIKTGAATPPLEFHIKLVGGNTHAVDSKGQVDLDLGPQFAVEPL